MTQLLLFQTLTNLCSDYEKLLALFDRISNTFPPGHLCVITRGQRNYFSLNTVSNGKHIQTAITADTTEGTALINQLHEKRVVFHGRRILRKNIQALHRALKVLQVYDPTQLAGNLPSQDTYPLPDRVFLPGQLNTGKWIRDTLTGNYRTNPYFLEDLKHESSAGQWLRSKSEADWDDELTEAGALFRYDSEIRLKSGKVIYADFVVLLPAENRLVIIEHFGRMDDPSYAMKNMRRLQEYAESGYILGRDLFFTMETKASPLTRSQIRATMRQAGLLPVGDRGRQ